MILLTDTERNSNLTSLSEKIANEFGRSISQGAGDCTKKGESLFLCPKSIMVGVLGSLRACWLLDPVVQPDTSTALSLDASVGSLITIVKELAMSLYSYTQNPTKSKKPRLNVRLKSLFNLVKITPQGNYILFKDLTFEQACDRINQTPDTLILKFSKMESV